MYSIKNNILYFIVIIIAVVEVKSLVELREDNKDLAVTEAALRKTVNGIFSTLKLDHVKHKVRFGEFAVIHNFFGTITLKDDNNLADIARLVKVDNIDNNTQRFIAQINEILNENNKSHNAGEDEYVTEHIATFITKLKYLKFKNDNAKLGINTQVLNYLRFDDTSENNTKTALKVNDGNHLNDIEFWTPNDTRRIFGGYRSKIAMFPFMASVQFFKKFQCGGSIIKSDLVITSASCLQLAWNNQFFREHPHSLSVQVGCTLYEGCDENIPVIEVYFHPEYNPKNFKHNLAIMRLVRIVKFGKNTNKIKKIDFDRDPSPLPANADGITIIGWGAESTSDIVSNVWNNQLRYTVLDFYPLKECQEVYSKGFVTETNFCAGFVSKRGGACNRDAGGPGVTNGMLYGVVSFGAPNCGSPDAPTVFTKLGFYAKWIEGIMNMEVPTGIKSTTEQMKREVTKPQFNVTPVMKNLATEALRTGDTLRNLEENKLFKEFIETMFGREEAKEYLDQYDSDSDIETQEKVTSKNIPTSIIVKPIAETTTKTKIEADNSGDEEVPQEVQDKRSLRMVRIIENYEAPVLRSEEEDTNRRPDTSLTLTMGVDKLSEQNIARLIHDIEIQDLLESPFDKSTVGIKPTNSKRTKYKAERNEIKSNKDYIKPKERQHNKNQIKLKRQKSQKEDKTDFTVESESVEETKTNDYYNDESGDDGHYDIYPDKIAKMVTFKQNSTVDINDSFSHEDLLKLIHEAVAEELNLRRQEVMVLHD